MRNLPGAKGLLAEAGEEGGKVRGVEVEEIDHRHTAFATQGKTMNSTLAIPAERVA
jgi:hypothetical protein